MNTSIEFTRVNNDVNGNPRYVCHFLSLVSDKEMEAIREEVKEHNSKGDNPVRFAINEAYEVAVKRAKKIGGKKFHNKQYGGGIVFQSYNIKETERGILKLLE